MEWLARPLICLEVSIKGQYLDFKTLFPDHTSTKRKAKQVSVLSCRISVVSEASVALRLCQ